MVSRETLQDQLAAAPAQGKGQQDGQDDQRIQKRRARYPNKGDTLQGPYDAGGELRGVDRQHRRRAGERQGVFQRQTAEGEEGQQLPGRGKGLAQSESAGDRVYGAEKQEIPGKIPAFGGLPRQAAGKRDVGGHQSGQGQTLQKQAEPVHIKKTSLSCGAAAPG